MDSIISAKGQCLCGAVKLHASKLNTKLGACHCEMCRRWSAGPFLALDCGTDVKIEGEENLTSYSSSDWAERVFCKKCGSNLFYKFKETGQIIASSELFDDLDVNFDHQIFIDEKPKYYDFSNKTKDMTGAEVFAAYSSGKD